MIAFIDDHRDAYGNGDEFAIMPTKSVKRRGRSFIACEIRTTAKLPETILTAAVGRPVTGRRPRQCRSSTPSN